MAVEALKLLLSKHSSEIILTTFHRFKYSLSEWNTIFFNRGIKIGKVSRIERETPFGETRKETVITWINEHNISPEEIIIIDDDKSLNGLPENTKKRLILTNSYNGLCSTDINSSDLFFENSVNY